MIAQFGVTGVLADPALSLYRDSTLVQSNDNWGSGNPTGLSTAFAQVGAFALTSTGSRDAALLVNLSPRPPDRGLSAARRARMAGSAVQGVEGLV